MPYGDDDDELIHSPQCSWYLIYISFKSLQLWLSDRCADIQTVTYGNMEGQHPANRNYHATRSDPRISNAWSYYHLGPNELQSASRPCLESFSKKLRRRQDRSRRTNEEGGILIHILIRSSSSWSACEMASTRGSPSTF